MQFAGFLRLGPVVASPLNLLAFLLLSRSHWNRACLQIGFLATEQDVFVVRCPELRIPEAPKADKSGLIQAL